MIRSRKMPLLYVDDTVEQRYAMRRILETEGYTVLEAGTGKEALQMLAKEPSLTILDVKLPDMSGFEVCRMLKELNPCMPVIQVSASFSDPESRVAGLSGGADAYIAQPVYPAELISLVRTLLQSSESADTLRFLAEIGPRFTTTLNLSAAAQNIASAMVPRFADRCCLYLPNIPGETESCWSSDSEFDETLSTKLVRCVEIQTLAIEDGHTIVAPLIGTAGVFGAIAFVLTADREYRKSDKAFAAELANRASLALQNCILYSSEQFTRAALIESEKLATAGKMSAAIAHEINNPLEAITNLIYIIEQNRATPDDIREHAASALSELSRIAHITRQSLGFYKELRHPGSVDLNESVTEILDLYKTRLLSKRININLKLAPSATITAIQGEIRQVISNLVVNAFEAMDPGNTLTIVTDCHDSHVLLKVIDDGPGIKSDVLFRIFDAFYTTKQGTGTGLGLWITRNIVAKHGGEISVTSSDAPDSHGTTFTVKFASDNS